MLLEELEKMGDQFDESNNNDAKYGQMAIAVQRMSLQVYLREILQITKVDSDPFKLQSIKGWTTNSLSHHAKDILKVISIEKTFVLSLLLSSLKLECPSVETTSHSFFRQEDKLYFVKYNMPLEYHLLMNSPQVFDIQDTLLEKAAEFD